MRINQHNPVVTMLVTYQTSPIPIAKAIGSLSVCHFMRIHAHKAPTRHALQVRLGELKSPS